MSAPQDRAAAQPGHLPALHPAVPVQGADPRGRAAVRGVPHRRGLRPDVRARQGRAARPRASRSRPAATRRGSRTRSATGSTAPPTRCPRSASSRTSSPSSAWPRRSGQQASLAGPASRALLKLKAAGVEPDDSSMIGLEPRVRTSEPSFRPCTSRGAGPPAGHVPYRTPDQAEPVTAAPRAVGRGLPARALVRRRASTATAAPTRVFRLSRVAGPVRRSASRARSWSPKAPTCARWSRATTGPEPRGEAVVRVRPGAGHTLRQRAKPSEPPARGLGRADRALRRCRGSWPQDVAGHGATVVAEEPPELRDGRRAPARAPRWRRRRERTGATDRLSRLLAMVPYLRRSARASRCARRPASSASPRTSWSADLELLFVCGTPGHMPDDLIEAEWEEGHVYLRNAETIARPLRLGVDEALALVVGLRMLADMPGLHDRDALDRTLAKLEAAAGEVAGVSRAGRRRRGRAGRRRAGRDDADGPAGAGRAAGGCTCATSSRAATRRPSATSTRCACSRRRPALPRGLVPPGRGGPAVPAGPGHRGRVSSTSAASCRPRRSPATWTRGCSGPRRTTWW